MKTLLRQGATILCAIVAICFLYTPAESAWQFSVAQQNTPAEFIVGTTDPVTYRVCNNSTINETLQRVRFYLANNTYSTLTAVSPTGWTCTRPTSLYIYCRANSSTYYIPKGTNCSQYKDFTFNVTSTALTQDYADKLSNVTARFSGSTTYRTIPPANLTPNLWTWKSFLMTLVPSAITIGQNCPFTVTMTVTNKLSATNIIGPNYVTSQPKPPLTTSLTGGATAATASVPANIVPLNAGVASSMTWTYTAGAALGTLNLSAYAKDSTGIRTSSTVTTPTITVNATACTFLVTSLTVIPSCLFTGDVATFTMVAMNSTGATLTTVAPSALTNIGTATIGAYAGPAPASYASLLSGQTGTFVWTAQVTSNPTDTVGQSVQVRGNATSLTPGFLTTNPLDSTTQNIDGYTIGIASTSTGVNSAIVNSTNEELVWTITNSACRPVNSVSIAIPAGWPAPGDVYSSVTNSANNLVDSWQFVSPAFRTSNYPALDPDELPVGKSGTFSLLFPSTPVTTGPYTFTTTITDTAGVAKVYNYVSEIVTVNPFDSSASGAPNYTETNIWHEDIK
jgi:hypothetical protein